MTQTTAEESRGGGTVIPLVMAVWRWPLSLQLAAGAVVGVLLGLAVRQGFASLAGATDQLELGGRLIVRVLQLLATPLIFFAVVDSCATLRISGRSGLRLLAMCLLNLCFAFAIGLGIMNILRPGEYWQESLGPKIKMMEVEKRDRRSEWDLTTRALLEKGVLQEAELRELEARSQSLSVSDFIRQNIPRSFLQPFVENQVLSVVLLALLVGLALRHLQDTSPAESAEENRTLVHFSAAAFRLILAALSGVVRLAPLAVMGMTAKVVAKFGVEVFAELWIFLAAILAGLCIHAFCYYPLAAWVVGGRRPAEFFRHGLSAILTGLFTNSSLATVPVTLAGLKRLGVSERAARLSACIGTNFNNDGITLYEAMAAIFLAQALQTHPTLAQQMGILLASILAAVSITGIPEAGIIVLPLVLSASGLSADRVAACLVLLYPLDAIIARVRSAVNVMGDLTVAIMLDRFEPRETPEAGKS